ncbi:MAG: MazG nucleotide pyrophosphohydrolase domain-containing protein [Thermodesulfobacteriota bacterium]
MTEKISLKRNKSNPKLIKKKRRGSCLKETPKNLSSLQQAYWLAQKASQIGFDWPNLEGVLEKLDEELAEFKEALGSKDRKRIFEEMGDLLFVLTNLARFLKIDPEKALKKTLKKFRLRFQYIESSLDQEGKSLSESNLLEMDQLWEEAKQRKERLK